MSNPKLALIPSGYKSGKVYSILPNDATGDFDFDRASEGTRVRKDGLIEEVTNDVPRLDWLNSNCPSLLLEPQRSNLFAYSEDTSQWASIRGTTTSNNIIAPNGELVGSLYEKTEDANEGYVYRNLTVSSVGTYSVSLFFKYNNSQYAHFLLFDGSSNGARAWFDIQNGVVGTSTTFGSTFTVSDLSIENYGNGWYKCSAKYVVTGTDTTWQFRVSPSGGNGVTNSDSGAKIYFFGAQIEQGNYPTSYIKTEASTVTRLKDECLNGGDSDLFNITEGTFFADVTPFKANAFHRITLSDGTTNEEIIYLFRDNNTQVTIISENSGVSQIQHTANITFETRNKLAFTFKNNEFKFYVNGSLVHTDTSGTIAEDLNALHFAGNNGAFNFFEGKVHDTRVYDRVLTQTEAEELTTL